MSTAMLRRRCLAGSTVSRAVLPAWRLAWASSGAPAVVRYTALPPAYIRSARRVNRVRFEYLPLKNKMERNERRVLSYGHFAAPIFRMEIDGGAKRLRSKKGK